MDPLALTLLGNQLPPLPKFTGDSSGEEDESVKEWLERLDMVAVAGAWSEQVKLVNLITRLRGSAYSFYRSCTPEQRTNYESLKQALVKRFTPVYLRSVRSSLFHERKQQQNESVDSFAQELKKLFYRAYPVELQGSKEAEVTLRSVLASQFIAGLKSNIKAKVAGVEGDFEELLAKARFEEARLRDFQPNRPSSSNITPRGPKDHQGIRKDQPISTPKPGGGSTQKKRICYGCGSKSHLLPDCPQRRRGAPTESPGKKVTWGPAKTVVLPSPSEELPEKFPPEVQDERETVINRALNKAMPTYGVNAIGDEGETETGPILTTKVCLEGATAEAILDTGSPVTIVSLEFLLQVLAQKKSGQQTPEAWKTEVKKRLKPPTVTLRSYGGGVLDVVGQICCQVSRGSYKTDAVIQVQNGAPVDLLIGTDLQPHLGFAFLQLNDSEPHTNLLSLQGSKATSQVKLPEEPDSGTETSATVRLLNATRLPGRHSKLVRAKVDRGVETQSVALFEPGVLDEKGLRMADAAVETRSGHHITLIIENESLEPVWLKKGQVLGTVRPASLVSWSEVEPDTPAEEKSAEEKCAEAQEGEVMGISAEVSKEPQEEQLLHTLGFGSLDLAEKEKN